MRPIYERAIALLMTGAREASETSHAISRRDSEWMRLVAGEDGTRQPQSWPMLGLWQAGCRLQVTQVGEGR